MVFTDRERRRQATACVTCKFQCMLRRSTVAALAAAVLSIVAPAQAAPVPAGQVVGPVPALDWQPCGPGLERFLCTTAEVPTDYDHPSGPKTRLALTKLPASGAPDQRLGTLFTNPGGPGGSGVDFVQQNAALIYAPELLARYDVLGFDPRGVARSDPATCFPTQADELASPLLAMLYPLPGPEETQYTLEAQELARRC